jgi:hypothetical protein
MTKFAYQNPSHTSLLVTKNNGGLEKTDLKSLISGDISTRVRVSPNRIAFNAKEVLAPN